MIRRFSNKDKSRVIELLRLNTPEYFDPSEQKDFENYLDKELEDYFVYEENNIIIGAGGINYFPEEKFARISWDMIDPKSHGKGIGKKITQFRIHHLSGNPKVELIIVRTTQLAYLFYEKMGFELEKIQENFWSENFDLYQMKLKNKNQ